MVDPENEQVMLKLSPLTFLRVMVTYLQSHSPSFQSIKSEEKSPEIVGTSLSNSPRSLQMLTLPSESSF